MAEIVIELCGPHNENVLFSPSQHILRGRWAREGMPSGATSVGSGLLGLPTIPGLHVALDVAGRQARIYDPLALPANKPLMNEVANVLKNLPGSFDYEPVTERVFKGLSDDQVASWHYHMIQLVEDAKLAVLISGAWASKINGDPVVDYFNLSSDSPRTLSDFKAEAERKRKRRFGDEKED